MNIPDKSLNTDAYGNTDPDKFRLMVEERAYFKAERRGFANGHELDDWLEAEQEISNQCRYWYLDNDPS
ncbi:MULTISPECIES: DUF2934 domain-containing protein [Methylomicrobium]|uniref:DUF2934 domain-containing protein n=1 Tax=Methylomicrobium album BG8 TaxID=686340 RepID=H8GG99_METAL|nr:MULTISPECIES: DUF2934 domain-containing protein [Methylomicrobium]EIC31179.1 Protein of unknown function (DUF2934) [Methylomicrobium album BG8]